MFKSYKNFWKNYFNFFGRSNRPDFWYPFLINNIIILVLRLLIYKTDVEILGVIFYLFLIVIFMPYLGSIVRRLHDVGSSGWCCLFILIPLVGQFLLIVWLAGESDCNNQYGDVPRTTQKNASAKK